MDLPGAFDRRVVCAGGSELGREIEALGIDAVLFEVGGDLLDRPWPRMRTAQKA